ncbi:MAG: hydrogenase maturation protease [Desulfovibrionaceae bacterium]|nr:hydrogenase maturation protease [Desulfovibrionaceae bacterium]
MKCVVMGIGNPLLSDDRAGIEVVERLEKDGIDVATEAVFTVGFEVLDKILGYDRAYIVDACVLGQKPGTIHEVSVEDIFTTPLLSGSHAMTLGTTLKTGMMVFGDEMPKELRIILIEAETPTEFSNVCTPAVHIAIEKTVVRIKEELAALSTA